jgi:hypothetical protein
MPSGVVDVQTRAGFGSDVLSRSIDPEVASQPRTDFCNENRAAALPYPSSGIANSGSAKCDGKVSLRCNILNMTESGRNAIP